MRIRVSIKTQYVHLVTQQMFKEYKKQIWNGYAIIANTIFDFKMLVTNQVVSVAQQTGNILYIKIN